MQRPASTYVVYDDPDSKIQFLEETLRGKDWHATIIYPDHNEESLNKRMATQAALERKGYIVKAEQDDCGHYALMVHHTGEGTKPSDVYRELGLAQGTAHFGSHPVLPLRYLLSQGQHAMHWAYQALHDPAQANGLINLVAEGFLAAAPLIDKSRHTIDFQSASRSRSARLQSLSGVMFGIQSFIYLFIAKNNEQVTVKELKDKMAETQRMGGDPTQLGYDEATDKPKHDIGHNIVRFLRTYPVQLGALFNDLGMLAYMGHAWNERKWKRDFLSASAHSPMTDGLVEDRNRALEYTKDGWSGYRKDMLGASLSLFAWPLLMLPRHETDEDTRKAHEGHPLAQLADRFRANPEQLAGLMTLGASSSRLMGAKSKANALQSIGETTYIGGDIALMFTKNDHYGNDDLRHVDKLAGKLAQHITSLPMVLGAQSQKEFSQNLTKFLLEKNLAEEAQKDGNHKHFSRAEIDERAARLSQAVYDKLAGEENAGMLRIAEAANKIAARFPEEVRGTVSEKLAETLSQQAWVHATSAEITTAMQQSSQIVKPAMRTTKLVQMKDIGKDIAELAFSVPGLDAGNTALALHDALSPFVRAQASDQQQLASAMTQQAASQLGLAAPQSTGLSR